MNKTLSVVGAGPAGLMAAGTALQNGWNVTVFDPNGLSLKKLGITGKGRCNLTNDCGRDALLANIPKNPRFLTGAFSRFGPRDTMDFFTGLGVPLKVERGGRVFPASDRAADVAAALRRFVSGAAVVREAVTEIVTDGGAVCSVRTANGIYPCRRAILATGGLSYPSTGSTGDGYKMAQKLGHGLTPLVPSLVPLVSGDWFCPELQGLTLKNVGLTAYAAGKPVFYDLGELLFTHYGISGPLTLSASAHIRDFGSGPCRVVLDLKPGLTPEMLDARILRDFSENLNKDYKNSLDKLLPQRMIPVIVRLSGIPPQEKVNAVTKKQRESLCRLLKNFEISVAGPRPIAEAVVTSGGVPVSEINPKTMESKLVPGLFFAGEIIDTDGYTGGFNLQIAWSTGFAAGSAEP